MVCTAVIVTTHPLFAADLPKTHDLPRTGVTTKSEPVYNINFPAQSLSKTLLDLAELTSLTIVSSPQLLAKKSHPAIYGRYTIAELLKLLLKPHGLAFLSHYNGYAIVKGPSPKLNNAQSQQNTAIEEVIVTGSRWVNQQSIALKKASPTVIMDALSADDIGDLPDINVADAFRRITGLNTLNDSDEGQFVVVRGMAPGMNAVTLDGMAIANDHANTRGINLETLPASSVANLRVYKTYQSQQDSHHLGGHLDMRSYSAFDRDETFFQVDTEIGQYSLTDVPDNDDGLSHRLTMDYSTLFGQTESFGLYLAATLQQKKRDEQKWDPRFRIIPPLVNTSNVNTTNTTPIFRERFNTAQYTNTWQRTGGNLKLEYQSDNPWSGYWHSYHYQLQENEHRDIWSIENTAVDEIQLNDNGGAQTSAARAKVHYTHRPTQRALSGHHLKLQYQLQPAQSLAFNITHSRGRYSRPQQELIWRTAATPEALSAVAYQYDDGSDFPLWRMNNETHASLPQNYFFDVYKNRWQTIQHQVTDVKLHLLSNLSPDTKPNRKNGLGYQLGIDYRQSELINDVFQEDRFWQGESPLSLTGFSENRASEDHAFIPQHFTQPMPFQSETAAFKYIKEHPNLFTSVASDTEYFSRRNDFQHSETLHAAFAQVRYVQPRWHLSGGVRYERTHYQSVGHRDDTTLRIATPNHYQNQLNGWFPSINWGYQFNEHYRTLISWSRTQAKPELPFINGLAPLKQSDDKRTLQTGNSHLQATQSSNWDWALEYYGQAHTPFDSTLLALNLFQKNIRGIPILSRQPPVEGQPNNNTLLGDRIDTVIQAENQGHAQLRGIELSVTQNQLPFPLQSFGLSSNLTWLQGRLFYEDLDGQRQQRYYLSQQPNLMLNANLFYTFWQHKGEFRIGYHYADRYANAIRPDKSLLQEEIWQPFFQVDTQLRLDLSETATLTFKVRNLTNQSRAYTLGTPEKHLTHQVVFGRSLWLGVNYEY